MNTIEFYKKHYGFDGEENIKLEKNMMVIPSWLMFYLVHKSGLKSRKKRIIKKVVKREINKAIRRGINAEK